MTRAATAALFLVVMTPPASAAGIRIPCGRPFHGKAVVHAIDRACPNEGARVEKWNDEVWASNRIQNAVKNNFCATGPTRTMTMSELVDLQHQAEALREAGTIDYGGEEHLPADRASLRKLGEGTRVRFRGFILGAHDARPNFFRGGESCNCNRRGTRWNDIHMTLAESKDAQACDGIVAEMSPHYRPALWHEDMLGLASARPVVVEGQLFFDADHEPCGSGKLGNPKRASLWEIHPVYELLVCRHERLEQCPLDDPNAWVPLTKWGGP
jgi:hypothetical protein